MNNTTIATALEALEEVKGLARTLDQVKHYRGATYYQDKIARINQAIADLEAATQAEPHAMPQDGAQWTPVENGMVYHYTDHVSATFDYPDCIESIEFLEVRGNGAVIACGSMPQEDEHEANLPDDVRLCRLTPASPAPEPRVNNVPLYTNEQIDDIVDKHIFLDNGTSTYRVWEDRANKYLREMRDKYEAELAFWQRYGVVKNLELVDAKGASPAPEGVTQPDDVREKLAEYAHEAWSGWMKYLFEKGYEDFIERPGDGKLERVYIMPEWARLRWTRQMDTPYQDLPEQEKESDRDEADKMLAIMRPTPVEDKVNDED